MKTKSYLITGSAFLMAFAGVSSAQAETSNATLSIVGEANYATLRGYEDADNVDAKSDFSFGGGALVGLPMGPAGQLELGGIYSTRNFDLTGVGSPDAFKYKQFELSALFRVIAADVLSVGAGGFYGWSSSSDLLDDYGLVGAVGIVVPMSDQFGLRLDARYNLGLRDLTQDLPGSPKSSVFQLLAGVQLHI